ncbi:MAG: hypothetical protein GY711_26345 [bacterium]|nr:hypothetical protein [bacterium]
MRPGCVALLRRLEVPGPVREPRAARVILVVVCALGLHGVVLLAARSQRLEPAAFQGLLVGLAGALASALVIGSIGEWLFHRYVMHRPSRFRALQVIYDLHHRGHHWVHFRPDTYAHRGPIQYVPVYPPRPTELVAAGGRHALSMLAQLGLYVVVASVLVLLPAWAVARNPLFQTVFSALVLIECWLFVRVHDLVHYPDKSWMQRLPGFRALDRHHYLHHLDPAANTNFLLPWGDVLFGTFRMTRTAQERRRWPRFEEARARLHDPTSAGEPEVRIRAHEA